MLTRTANEDSYWGRAPVGAGVMSGVDPTSEVDDEEDKEPIWPKALAGVLTAVLVLQIVAVIAVAAGEEEPSPAPTPPPPPTTTTPAPAPPPLPSAQELAAATQPPPAPPTEPPAAVDPLARVHQFEHAITHAEDPALFGILDTLVSENFVANFGAGCSIIGGGVYCDEGSYTLEEYKALITDVNTGTASSGLIHVYGETEHTVTDHYRTGESHGAVVYHFDGLLIDEIFYYADQGENVRNLQEFYRIVDTKGLGEDMWPEGQAMSPDGVPDSFDALVGENYLAVFGPGTAKVGGATHSEASSEPDLMDRETFKQFVMAAPARCLPSGCTAAMERTFIVEGDTVVNHYVQTTPAQGTTPETVTHAVAVHEFHEGKLVESYWYSDHSSSQCAPPTHELMLETFLERVDMHFLPTATCRETEAGTRGDAVVEADAAACAEVQAAWPQPYDVSAENRALCRDVQKADGEGPACTYGPEDSMYVPVEELNFEEFLHVDYQAVFSPGCVLIGRQQRCGPTPAQLTRTELEEFVNGAGKFFPGGLLYGGECESLLLTTINASNVQTECSRTWTYGEIAAMVSCTSVHLQTYDGLCVANSIMSEGDSVVDTYRYQCGGQSSGCDIDDHLPHGACALAQTLHLSPDPSACCLQVSSCTSSMAARLLRRIGTTIKN